MVVASEELDPPMEERLSGGMRTMGSKAQCCLSPSGSIPEVLLYWAGATHKKGLCKGRYYQDKGGIFEGMHRWLGEEIHREEYENG